MCGAEEAKESKDVKAPKRVEQNGSVTIGGQVVEYVATSGELALRDDAGKETAKLFYVSYVKKGGDAAKRPVLFAFNGGPGSSSVWLHLGFLGPKRVDLPGDGMKVGLPQSKLVENGDSVLDECDVVLVDPVATGYSRAEKEDDAGKFYGLEGDIASVGDFMRSWLTEQKRWASPKFVLGESYGGVRASGLAEYLQQRYGMNLNGVVLMSSLMDFRTIMAGEADDVSFQVYLPTYVALARYFGKIEGDRDALVKAAHEFAWGEYGQFLTKGEEVSLEEKRKMAAQLAKMTGVGEDVWMKNDLRVGPGVFRVELLRDQGKVMGRFDGRVTAAIGDEAASEPEFDPSFALVNGAFSAGMMQYLTNDLKWEDARPYEILTDKVQPWKWNTENRYVNTTSRLMGALRDNPQMGVMVMCGHADLATPAEGILYSFRHARGINREFLEKRLRVNWYEAGHMFYLNPKDREKGSGDLRAFIREFCEPQGL